MFVPSQWLQEQATDLPDIICVISVVLYFQCAYQISSVLSVLCFIISVPKVFVPSVAAGIVHQFCIFQRIIAYSVLVSTPPRLVPILE